MFCTKCGNQVDDDLKFCPKCGQRLAVDDNGKSQKTGSRFTGIALKVIGIVLLAVAIGAFKYFTRGMSPWQIKRQTAELVEQCVNESELTNYVHFVKVEGLELEKQKSNHYIGTAWVWFNRKENPTKHPVRFRYSLDVKVVNNEINLEQKMSKDEAERFGTFVAGESESTENEDNEEDNDNEDSDEDVEKVDYGEVTVEKSAEIIREWSKCSKQQGLTSVQQTEILNKFKGTKVAMRGWVSDVSRMHLFLSQITGTDGEDLYVSVTNSEFSVVVQMASGSDGAALSLQCGDSIVVYGRMFDWDVNETLLSMIAFNGISPLFLSQGVVVQGAGDTVEGEADDISAEYEKILREAMPVAMAMQGVPKDKIEVVVAEELKKEMARFQKLSDEEKLKELKKAKEEILPQVRAMQKGGEEADAVLKAKKDGAASIALAKEGRSLFVAIVAANVEREAAGMCSLWPRSNAMKSAGEKDISGMSFGSSTEYFKALLNGAKPYLEGVKSDVVIASDSKISKWHVACNITDELDDCIPVLVSANVDIRSLIVESGRHDGSALTGTLRFSGDYAVVVHKGGSTKIIQAKNPSLVNVYWKGDFSIPQGFGYLSAAGDGTNDSNSDGLTRTKKMPFKRMRCRMRD